MTLLAAALLLPALAASPRTSAALTLRDGLSRPGSGTSLRLAASPLGSSPPYLQHLALADDPADGYVVAFGGESPGLTASGLTLSYLGGTWQNLTSSEASAPAPRWGASMAYDAVDHELVLFGGCQTGGCYPALGDTWGFYGGQWHDLTSLVGTGPSARGFAALAWDTSLAELVLFGGETGNGSSMRYLSDTWSFVHDTWTNLTSNLTGAAPPARASAMTASVGTVPPLLFGGRAPGGYLADTWSFGGTAWANRTGGSGTAPSPRAGGMLAGDPRSTGLVLFGGYSGSYLRDSWTWANGTWSELTTTGPPGTYGAGFAYDAEDGYLLLYGGSIEQSGEVGTTNAYWSLENGAWHLWNPAPEQPIDWFVIVPFVAILAVVGGEFAYLRRRQARRWGELSDRMPDPLGAVTWIPTQPASLLGRATRRGAAVIFGVMVPMGTLLSLVIVTTATPGSEANTLVFLAAEWSFFLAVPGLVLASQANLETRAIGIADAGILVRRKRTELRVPWEYLQPPTTVPKGPTVGFPFLVPGKQTVPNYFAVTHEQARAILAHPRAAAWPVPPPVRTALGLPGGPLDLTPTPPTQVPLPSSAIRAPTPLDYRLRNPQPQASPAAPPTGGPRDAPLAGAGSPQLRRCPRCSSLATIRARFCGRCGAPLA